MNAKDARRIANKEIKRREELEENEYKEFVKNNKKYLETVEKHIELLAKQGAFRLSLTYNAPDNLIGLKESDFTINLLARYFREAGFKFEIEGHVISWADDE